MTPTSRSASPFDRWSATYDRAGVQRFTYRPIHDAVLARIDALVPSTVVDLGCGTGQLTQRMIGRFPDANIIGVDFSGGMLTEAADRLRRAGSDDRRLVRADALQLPFAASSVDLVVCTESFHWYRDPAGALNELARVVNPGGRLLIASIATATDVGDRLLTRATGAAGRTVRALPPHRMRQLLASAGFDVIAQRRIPRLGPILWPLLTDARRH